MSLCLSDQLAVSGLHVRCNSFSAGSKQGTDLLGKDGTESEPDRDIELELSALDMEDSETQDCNSEVTVAVLKALIAFFMLFSV